MMYKALRQLRGHLALPLISQAWPSINCHTFAVVIFTTVHNIWLLLLHWHELEKNDVFYKFGGTVLQLFGAGPYTPDFPNRSLDQHLTNWLAQSDGYFHPDIGGQATAFMDVTPLTWSHIFGPTESVNRPALQHFRCPCTNLPHRPTYRGPALALLLESSPMPLLRRPLPQISLR